MKKKEEEKKPRQMPLDYRGDPNWKPKPASGIPAKGAAKHPPLSGLQQNNSRARITYLNKVPKDKETQNALANEMIEWVGKNSHNFYLGDFPLSKKMSPYRFFKIALSNTYFAECLEFCRYVMLSGMNHVNLKDPTIYTMRQHNEYQRWWDKDYAKQHREMIELKKNKPLEEINRHQAITVVMERAPSSELVKEKDETSD